MATALFDLVKQYHQLGEHQTGSPVDSATVDWMTEQLISRGLNVVLQPVTFDHWSCESTLTANGAPIEHLAVPYEWTGRLDTDQIAVSSFDPMSGGFPPFLDSEICAHVEAASGRPLILATEHPNGSLVAVNRPPIEGSGVPTVLIAGRDIDSVSNGQLHLAMTATRQPGTTANVVGTNDVSGPPLLLTTPLTGWFGCAGERATGIAVLLDMVDRFSHLPLIVVSTAGHEVGHFGAEAWLGETDIEPAAIVHVGASVAVLDADDPDELSTFRVAMTNEDADRSQPIAETLTKIGLALRANTDRWVGEAQTWSTLGVPLLSFSRAGIDFHTPNDTPERATSPAALERVANTFAEAIASFVKLTPAFT